MMAMFARESFKRVVADYASFRPTYPHQLFEFVFRYHEQSPQARWETAVDLGCGTGQATVGLATRFRSVVGLDSSENMISVAREHTAALGIGNCDYVHSPSEMLLDVVPEHSVDLVVAAQAAHWFDFSKVWLVVAKALRPGGSVAFWGYSEFRLPKHPSLTPLIITYAQGSDPVTSLGPHWQQPGRGILVNHFLDVPAATEVVPEAYVHWERVYFAGNYYPDLPSPRPVLLQKRMTWSNLLAYMRTWSSLHAYHEQYPADRHRPDGDIAARFCRRLREESGGADEHDEVDVEWPIAVLLARTKA